MNEDNKKITKERQPCPFPDCMSSDGYFEYADGHSWCYSCNKGKFPKEVYNVDKFEEVYTTDRGVPVEVMEKFGIKSYIDDDGFVHFHKYTSPDGSKIRRCIDKNFYVEGKVPKLWYTELYDPGASPIVTVVEGQIDAPSAYHMLNSDGRVKIERPVVALDSASVVKGSRKEIFDKLNPYDKIILAIENDERGNEARAIIAEMMPSKTFVVTLNKHKDANDYLTSGDEEVFKRAWSNASRFVPKNIINSNEDFFSIIDDKNEDSYVPTPFSSLNKLIKGLPLGHIVLILGQEGLGKTEILRSFEWSLLSSKTEKHPIGVLHFEEKQRTTLFGYSCYHLGKNVRDPDNDYRTEVKKSIEEWNADGRLHLFDVDEDSRIETVVDTIRYLTVICGCKYIFIDPINQFASMQMDDTKTRFFDALSQSLEKFAVKHNVCFVWTAHANDEGKTRDSRMIGKSSSIRIEIDRNIEAEDSTVKNTTHMKVTKNRFCGETGRAGSVIFNPIDYTIGEGDEFNPEEVQSPSGKTIKAM